MAGGITVPVALDQLHEMRREKRRMAGGVVGCIKKSLLRDR